ncbi:hypothetical protein ACFCXS_18630 [Streptomyces sp. NPDC056373]|uniref:hypothetical protein n=1 Tax=Streptomyces sp. NPDC056373 TaxID=3345798 RepID=UPI0035DDF92B
MPEPVARAPLLGAGTHQHRSGKIVRETAAGVRLRHPSVEVAPEHVSGRPPSVEVAEVSRPGNPADRLISAPREASLIVVGRRVRRHPLPTGEGPRR